MQYWDEAASAWQDVVDQSGAPNPVVNWETHLVADESQLREFTFPAVTTTRVRAVIEAGATAGHGWLEEIEAYGDGARCEHPDLALPADGGQASASSVHSGAYSVDVINDGLRQGGSGAGYWNDGTQWAFPDSAEISWAEPQRLDTIVVRVPVGTPGPPVENRTLGLVRVQYWDADASSWIDVEDLAGTPNPIVDWVTPTTPDPAQARTFTFAPITTTQIRVLIERGSADGWSWLDEIEAYGPECGNPDLAMMSEGGQVAVSSVYSPYYSAAVLNDGRRQGGTGFGYWNDEAYAP